jgi:hypothetical protein
MRFLSNATAGLLGLVFLAGCSTPPRSASPPASLLAPCVGPSAQGLKTNADLVRHVVDLRGALASCNDDKAALRVWAKELEK